MNAGLRRISTASRTVAMAQARSRTWIESWSPSIVDTRCLSMAATVCVAAPTQRGMTMVDAERSSTCATVGWSRTGQH